MLCIDMLLLYYILRTSIARYFFMIDLSSRSSSSSSSSSSSFDTCVHDDVQTYHIDVQEEQVDENSTIMMICDSDANHHIYTHWYVIDIIDRIILSLALTLDMIMLVWVELSMRSWDTHINLISTVLFCHLYDLFFLSFIFRRASIIIPSDDIAIDDPSDIDRLNIK